MKEFCSDCTNCLRFPSVISTVMEIIQLLFVATQLLHLSNSADNSLKDRLWETQQRWCVPHHYSCSPTEDPFVYQTRSQQGTRPNKYGTQQVNQSSTTVVTGDPDHSSMKHVNQSSKTAATGDTYRNSTQQVNQSLTTAATCDPDRSSTQQFNHNSRNAVKDDDDHNFTHLANQRSSADVTEQSACCGFCSCEDDCAEYGSCCLSEYRNLNYGREMVDKAAAKYVFLYF